MLAAGIAMATGIYVATTPDPRIPMDLVAQLPAFALIVIFFVVVLCVKVKPVDRRKIDLLASLVVRNQHAQKPVVQVQG